MKELQTVINHRWSLQVNLYQKHLNHIKEEKSLKLAQSQPWCASSFIFSALAYIRADSQFSHSSSHLPHHSVSSVYLLAKGCQCLEPSLYPCIIWNKLCHHLHSDSASPMPCRRKNATLIIFVIIIIIIIITIVSYSAPSRLPTQKCSQPSLGQT